MKTLRDIILIYIPAGFLLLSLSWVLAYRWLPVKWTPLMLVRTIENRDSEGYENKQNWVSLENVNPVLIESILMSEDQRFFSHKGFDWIELAKMKGEHDKIGRPIRGCSTISQQVAKNCFTFCGHSWWRKGFETYYTVLIELFWSKERIMEVYLNIAEMGKGIYGVEAAAQKYFDRSAAKLNTHQAVCIACVLPNPLVRSPKTVPQKNKSKYNTTFKRTEQTPYPFVD